MDLDALRVGMTEHARESSGQALKIISRQAERVLGYPDTDLLQRLQSIPNLVVTPTGAEPEHGFLISRSRSSSSIDISHLHIVPHGGTEIPAFLRKNASTLIGRSEFGMARAIRDNYDSSTTAIAHEIALRIARNEDWKDSILAYFPVTRLIADVNRVRDSEQIPSLPYSGYPILRPNLGDDVKKEIHNYLIRPWLDSVKRHVQVAPLVFHHHTFDVEASDNVAHDRSPADIRPVMQFFWRLPREGYHVSERGDEIIDVNLLTRLRAIARDAWKLSHPHMKEPGMDSPYELPLIPFLEASEKNPTENAKRQHIIYEVRKDCLVGLDRLTAWMKAIDEMVETSTAYIRENRP